MNRAQLFSYLFLTGFSVIAFACQGGEGGKGGTGGKGGSVVIVNQNGGAGLNGKKRKIWDEWLSRWNSGRTRWAFLSARNT